MMVWCFFFPLFFVIVGFLTFSVSEIRCLLYAYCTAISFDATSPSTKLLTDNQQNIPQVSINYCNYVPGLKYYLKCWCYAIYLLYKQAT